MVFSEALIPLCSPHLGREMYDFLISNGAGSRVAANGLTPLKLCVRLGKLSMFEHIVTSRMIPHSTWGPVRHDLIALDEIDTIGLPGSLQVVIYPALLTVAHLVQGSCS